MDSASKRKYKKHKEGYTVSITHFLRKDKNFLEKLLTKSDTHEKPKLPIYIRVSFLQQTAIIRSRLTLKLIENEFEPYLEQPDIKKFIAFETTAIRQSIEEFGPDKTNNFLMSQWTEHYNKSNYTIEEVLQTWLTNELCQELESDYAKNSNISTDLDQQTKYIIRLMSSSFIAIQTLARIGTPRAEEYVKRFAPLFQIDFFESTLGKIATFTVWDWRTGNYTSLIYDLHGSVADPYLKLLDKILPDYQEIMTQPASVQK
ncbi:hypothetical protein [Spirosoma arcticum]